jgi:NAD(P) transhydrogenase
LEEAAHTNTIPSKALRHASQILYETNSLNQANFQTLLKKAEIVIQDQFILRKGFYERNLVDIIDGRASFSKILRTIKFNIFLMRI